ncbi:hypothetical protein L3V77_22175 [Vibrio sp. DW001]|uniref:hypothetical protein n=1 Tax=Vibrio sp. DW001 TaxID=2912315 RepID=UPI0023B0E437|nr:hypothetical protein [Vibrio sp. DW001]WED28654.1 hypothetical protein L3V77_22175 [Vibrio sp. DW001]
MRRIVMLIATVALLIFSVIWVSSCSHLHDYESNSGAIVTGVIEDTNLAESSGLAISKLNTDTLWSHNDSDNSPSLIALDLQGKFRAKVNVQGVENIDWEDMATFKYNEKNYLIIADTGDNFAVRDEYLLHIIQEPLLTKRRYLNPIQVIPEWSISYTYADGPRDCESIAIDIINKKIILLSKRDEQPILFELTLNRDTPQVATNLGAVPSFPKPSKPKFSFIYLLGYSSQPTAMDISSDGRFAAVLTYDSAFLYDTKGSTDWHTVLSSTPVRYELPTLKQAESLSFGSDNRSIYVTTEHLPAPIITFPVDVALSP